MIRLGLTSDVACPFIKLIYLLGNNIYFYISGKNSLRYT
jgi:hypothetical protein